MDPHQLWSAVFQTASPLCPRWPYRSAAVGNDDLRKQEMIGLVLPLHLNLLRGLAEVVIGGNHPSTHQVSPRPDGNGVGVPHRPLHLRAVPPHLRVIPHHALLTDACQHGPVWPFHALASIVGLKAGLPRCLARLAGDGDGARAFATLGRIVGRLVRGQADQAGRCLRRVVQQ